MKCKLCGGEAKELGGNRYRCNYCAHEFEGVIETVNNNTHAHNKSNAESENRGRDFIIGNVLGTQDFVNPPTSRSEFLERTSQIYQQLDNAGRSSTTDTSTPNANPTTNTKAKIIVRTKSTAATETNVIALAKYLPSVSIAMSSLSALGTIWNLNPPRV